jgi:hypothetical protein
VLRRTRLLALELKPYHAYVAGQEMRKSVDIRTDATANWIVELPSHAVPLSPASFGFLIDCEALDASSSNNGIRGLSLSSEPTSEENAGRPWKSHDVFFLEDALARGMSYAEVAGFLGRSEEEVRAKAEELRRQE